MSNSYLISRFWTFCGHALEPIVASPEGFTFCASFADLGFDPLDSDELI